MAALPPGCQAPSASRSSEPRPSTFPSKKDTAAVKPQTFFSSTYAEARRRFREAHDAAGARLESHECPAKGPEGEPLTTDVAWLGPADAAQVLVTISATHGVEGFCGSGVQLGWLESGLAAEMPGDVALMQIHAINPHGFAWLRRVTEDNVDLNRNFIDHDEPHPVNPGYQELAEVICPREWNDSIIAETALILDNYAEAHGPKALQKAISGGQYSHADGIFFGGAKRTWSANLLVSLLEKHLAQAKRVAVIDYHTGLGPRGHGERICIHEPDSAGLARAGAWYDDDITSPALGTSASVELFGFNVAGMETALAHTELTAIALEFGTQPSTLVRQSLRADNWLHLHGELASPKGRAIKRDIRDAFYQDQDDWKEMIFERSVETQKMALAGLAQG